MEQWLTEFCSYMGCNENSTLCLALPTNSAAVAAFCGEHYFTIREIRYELNDFEQCLRNFNAPRAISMWQISDIENITDILATYYFLKFYKSALQRFKTSVSRSIAVSLHVTEQIVILDHNIALIEEF